jgi:hypothetical protein
MKEKKNGLDLFVVRKYSSLVPDAWHEMHAKKTIKQKERWYDPTPIGGG